MPGIRNYIPVKEFYNGKSVLVTGATGFVGKVLVEKLLWSCPGIRSIYVLIRSKENKGVVDRWAEILNTPVFDRFRGERREELEKIIPLEGDIVRPFLGLRTADRDLLANKVSIVLHSAATIRLNDNLKTCVAQNLVGTMNVIELSREIKPLEVLVHVSTAYCNCDREKVEERVYPTSHDPHKIIQMMETLDEEKIREITPKIIGKHVNSYMFTKALTENFIAQTSHHVPFVIVRPSLVLGSLREPVPGWIDNWNGVTGLVSSVAYGLLHSVLCNGSKVVDLIPVDFTANLIICAAWRAAAPSAPQLHVYHGVSGQRRPISWQRFFDHFLSVTKKMPMSRAVFRPYIFLHTHRIWYKLCTLFLETMPSYVLDAVYDLARTKKSFVSLHQKNKNTRELGEIVTTSQWIFMDDNVRHLNNLLSDEDRKKFPFDVQDIDWLSYIEIYHQGIRRFLLKEMK